VTAPPRRRAPPEMSAWLPKKRHSLISGPCVEESAFDLPSGDVAGVKDATFAVPAFATEIELLIRRLTGAEAHPKFNEFSNECRPLCDNGPHHVFFAKTGARV